MKRREPPHTLKRFGQALADRRHALGLSQQDLADRLALESSENISRYERGLREPRLETLLRLAAALETTPAELVVSLSPESETEACDWPDAPNTEDLRELDAPDPELTETAIALVDALAHLSDPERERVAHVLSLLLRCVEKAEAPEEVHEPLA